MRKKILIVDDEIDTFGFLQDTLEDYGYSVISVDNGENAIRLAKNNHFNVIFLDINLLDIDGVEVFKQIKKISPLSSVIMMSAAASESMIKKAVEEGSFAVLDKPFKLDKIVDTVDQALDKPTIIIADSSKDNRESLQALLEQKGFKYVSADSSQEFLDMLKLGRPDIIFLGSRLSDVNGFEVIEKAKAVHPDGCIIMMGDYLKDGNLEKSLNKGAFGCINKPFKLNDVIEIIERIKDNVLHKDHPNIVLIEDDVALQVSLKDILNQNYFNVAAVGSGFDAIEESKKRFYDAALVDYKLPDMSGIDVIKKIKEVNPNIVVIMMTAHESLDVTIAAIREQVFDFLVKPVKPKTILNSLKKGLAGRAKNI